MGDPKKMIPRPYDLKHAISLKRHLLPEYPSQSGACSFYYVHYKAFRVCNIRFQEI